MNILIVITPFYPAQTPNTLRWNAIIKEFIDNGYKVTVLTTNWTSKKGVDLHEGVKIYRTGHNSLLDFLYDKLSIRKRRNVSQKPNLKPSNWFVNTLEKIVDKFWRNNYWPDGSVMFLKPGKKIVSEIVSNESITHVISVGLPFTSHLIGREIKKRHPNINWLMDVEDPFSISDSFWVNNFSKYAMKNIEAEEDCIKHADAISFTNENVNKIYSEMFDNYSDKYFVIPPLFSFVDDNKENELKIELDSDLIHLAYFGSFYKGVRSPFKFLKFIDKIFKEDKAKLEKIKFHFYGELNKFNKPIFLLFDHLSPFIIHHGFIDHRNLSKYIDAYDILLNFGNTTTYHLPSKVVEFLYFDKPLINIISTDEDSTKQFLNDKIEILNLLLERDPKQDQIETFLEFVLAKRHVNDFNLELVEPYLQKNIANQYLKILG